MGKELIKLKDILKEDEVDDAFGDVAFGSNWYIARLQGKNEEDDTELEGKLLSVLYTWLDDSSSLEQDELYKVRNLLKKASGRFPKIFKPDTPNGTLLYRGINPKYGVGWPLPAGYLKYTTLAGTLSKSDFTKNEIPSIRGDIRTFWRYNKPIKYTPSGKVQSWTSDASIGVAFSTGILLQTKQNNEYLFNQEALDILWNELTGKPSEQEILHFGKTYSEPVYLMLSNFFYQKYVKG